MDTSIIKLRVRDLIPYARNPRRNDEAVEVIKNSLQEFGYINRIVVDCNGEIIAGHTRLKAMIQLGWQDREIEVIRYDAPAEKVKAYRLADNRTGEKAEWDDELLALELEDLQDSDIDMDLLGFDDYEPIEELTVIDGVEEPPIPETPEDPITKPGDIITLGDHMLMCGDSTNGPDMLRLMDGSQADLVVTDPPYNVNYEGKTADRLKIENDHMSDNQFLQFLINAFTNFQEVLKAGGGFTSGMRTRRAEPSGRR